MLNPKFNYIAFDFEMTGLDTKKDVPIQIGIVQFDHNCKVKKSFQSLIKPTKNIKQLKDIVTRLTGFTLQDLENAPSINDVFQQCKHFFTENTIVVGHNINFDVTILRRYIAFNPKYTIDTFELAKYFLHFQESYALDVLNAVLQNKGLGRNGPRGSHDALYDSFASYKLFSFCIHRRDMLRKKYKILDIIGSKSSGIRNNILQIHTNHTYAQEQKKLFLPPLRNRSKRQTKSLYSRKISFQTNQDRKRYIGHISRNSVIRSILQDKKNIIFSFSHKGKTMLVEQLLNQIQQTYHSLHDYTIFDQETVCLFLKKKSFSDNEILFLVKYFSQYDQGHKLLDINNLSDYKIFQALTTLKKQKQIGVMLCTHQQLFQFTHNISNDCHIFFFDHERRYHSYRKFTKQEFDPLHFINLIDQLVYKYGITNKNASEILKQYMQKLQIFVGLLCIDINNLFKKYSGYKQDIDYILDHTRFPKTKATFSGLNNFYRNYILSSHIIKLEDKQRIDKQRHHLHELLTGLCVVEKRIYQGENRYYILYKRDTYIQYEEFLQHISHAKKYYLLSNSDTNLLRAKISNPKKEQHNDKHSRKHKNTVSYKQITQDNKLIDMLQKQNISGKKKIFYIFSSSKQESRKIFQKMIHDQLDKKFCIIGENITGGQGKNMYLMKQTKKSVICIGGYTFYLYMKAKKVDFSCIYLYHISGNMKEQIIHDIFYYTQNTYT